ncbi:ubiquinone anaerobic biosynthesis accessory factor UbiT [Arenimonas soli]|nr:SCP2 sterol-binding domain-containing protein [Arenimonas soli]
MTHIPLAVSLLRRGVDGLDDAMLLMMAGRRRLVAGLAAAKRRAGLPVRDPAREDQVLARGHGLARRLGLPPGLARSQLELLIADACRLQDPESGGTMTASVSPSPLRWFPPPRRWAPLLRLVPAPWQRQALEQAVGHLLARPIGAGDLDFMQGRRLGIEVSDLGLAWVLELDGTRLRAVDAQSDASVRGSATDLLLLASRLEDADTLFFQRRLEVTGDTELGLTARNLLDRLPWESVPLGVRILLNRGARAARAAREAWQGDPA